MMKKVLTIHDLSCIALCVQLQDSSWNLLHVFNFNANAIINHSEPNKKSNIESWFDPKCPHTNRKTKFSPGGCGCYLLKVQILL